LTRLKLSDGFLQLLTQGLFYLGADTMLLCEVSTEEIGLGVLVNLDLVFLSVHADVDSDTVFAFSLLEVFLILLFIFHL
jgi:hypothetical protein